MDRGITRGRHAATSNIGTVPATADARRPRPGLKTGRPGAIHRLCLKGRADTPAVCDLPGAPARRRTAPTKTGRRRSGHCCRKLIPATTTKPGCPSCRPEAARRQAYPCQNARPAQRRKDQEKGRNARLADARRTHDAQPMDRSTAMPAQRAPHHHLTMSKQHPANPALERAGGRQAGFPSGTAGPRHRPTMAAAPPSRGSGGWWAWADLNGRPHAYQACALTS